MISKEEALKNLKNSKWIFDEEVQKIFKLLDGENNSTMAVGGFVRDSLLGIENKKKDIDFATILLPEQVIERAKAANIAYYPIGIEHGTITLRIGERTFEITTLRQDIETDGRHAKVKFGTDWGMDAKRRDFYINALYVNMRGELFDPIGGLEDCLKKRVRFIGNADNRINEDRLRVYRFFRFSASHGEQKFDEEGLIACQRAADKLGNISRERIGAEMMNMLKLKKIALTLNTMKNINIIPFDEAIIYQLEKFEQICLDENIKRDIARLAIIIHQFSAKKLQNMWRLANWQIRGAQQCLKGAETLTINNIAEVAYRYADYINMIPFIAGAIFDWDREKVKRISNELGQIKVKKFPIDGRILLEVGVSEGVELGKILARLEKDWIESGFNLSKEELLSKI